MYLKVRQELKSEVYSSELDVRIEGGKKLYALENKYTLDVGLYEYNLLTKLRRINDNVHLTDEHWFWLDLCVLLTALHIKKNNILFIICSILLPIVGYCFFVLMDYYELMEEIMELLAEMEEEAKYSDDLDFDDLDFDDS